MTLGLIILASIFSTLLGGIFAIKLKDRLHLILGFSAGAVLGVALFDLLPEAIDLASGQYDIRTITLFIAAGFSAYMLTDRLFSLHGHDKHGDCKNPHHHNGLGASALVVHSFLDGLGIGLAFKVSSTIGLIVAIAVIAHDFSDGINTVNMVLRDRRSNKQAFKWLLADALAPTVGVLSASFVSVSSGTLGLILAVFVGLFLYISASDLVPESHHRHPAIWTTISTILGMAVIFIAVNFA